uniref:Polyprotein n=1 Tax=Solanum tuberosum TaxID=4113 RepID=M1DRK3_SOLTU
MWDFTSGFFSPIRFLASRPRIDRFPIFSLASIVSVTNQFNQQVPILANASGGSVAARVRDFVRMNPTEFLGSQIGEDPQNFIDEVKKIFEVIVKRTWAQMSLLSLGNALVKPFWTGGSNNRSQSTTSTAPAGRLTQQGNSSGIGGGQRQNKLYALQARQD